MNPSPSAFSDDTYHRQHQQSRPLPRPPVPPSQQQYQPYDTNNDNFSSRRYGENQRAFCNFSLSEQQHRGTRYNHPEEGSYKDRDIASDSKNYPPPYGRTEGVLPPYNYSDHPRSRFEQGTNANNNNNNNTMNMLHSNSLPPVTNDNYPPNYSRSGFRPEQFPDTNVPPPQRPSPLHMHQQVMTRLPSQPPPTRPQPPPPSSIREQAGFYSGVNYVPQQKNVATPEYPGNFNLPPFPGLDTSCPPPSLPPPPLPPVIPHTPSVPSAAAPSPLPPQYLKPCSAPLYLGTDSSNSIVSSIPSNTTSIPPPPPLVPSFISPPLPPLVDNQFHGDNSFNTPLNSGPATSNFSVPPPLTPVYGSRTPQKPDNPGDSEYSQIDDALQHQRQQDKDWIEQKFSTKIQDRPSKKPSTITVCPDWKIFLAFYCLAPD